MASKLNLTVNGKPYECFPGTSLQMISRDFKQDYPHDIIIARCNGKLVELATEVKNDCNVEFLTTGDELGNRTLRRTACMVLIKAISDLYGKGQKIKIQYSLDKGYYCELPGMKVDKKVAAEIKKHAIFVSSL